MGKSLLSARTPYGTALFGNCTSDFRNAFCLSKRQHGRFSVKTVLFRRILAIISYVTKGYCKDESLQGNDGTVRTTVLSNVSLIFSGRPQAIDHSGHDQLVEDILQRAHAYRNEGSPQSHRSALVLGLIAVSWCVTTGSSKTSSGERLLTRLRFFFRLYRMSLADWEWIADHADMQGNDFVGLLSVVLTKTHFPTEQDLPTVNAGRLEGKVA